MNGETKTWPELAIGLYDQLTERNAEIMYAFDDLHIGIPSSADSDATKADWHLNGAIRIKTQNGNVQ